MKTVALGSIAKINPDGPSPGDLKLEEPLAFVPMANVSENGTIVVKEHRLLHEVSKSPSGDFMEDCRVF
jgi:hypothetical protein